MDPKDVGQWQHEEFYRYIAQAHDKPRYTLHYKTDAPLNIRSIFYVPEMVSTACQPPSACWGCKWQVCSSLSGGITRSDSIFHHSQHFLNRESSQKYPQILRGSIRVKEKPVPLGG